MRLPLETPLIQVAGIRDAAEAALVQESGIRYLGFPLRLPVNREDLTEARPRRSSATAGRASRGGCAPVARGT